MNRADTIDEHAGKRGEYILHRHHSKKRDFEPQERGEEPDINGGAERVGQKRRLGKTAHHAVLQKIARLMQKHLRVRKRYKTVASGMVINNRRIDEARNKHGKKHQNLKTVSLQKLGE